MTTEVSVFTFDATLMFIVMVLMNRFHPIEIGLFLRGEPPIKNGLELVKMGGNVRKMLQQHERLKRRRGGSSLTRVRSLEVIWSTEDISTAAARHTKNGFGWKPVLEYGFVSLLGYLVVCRGQVADPLGSNDCRERTPAYAFSYLPRVSHQSLIRLL